jgi:hypothetical protein
MRISPLLLLPLLACPRGPDDGNTVTGQLEGEVFDPDTVVFDSYGASPDDSAAPEQRQLMLVLADAPEACALLGPLFHYWWLRCESTCAGLYANQDLWPDEPLRVLWIGLTEDEGLEASYELATSSGPGLFTADYLPVDLSPLQELDEAGCYDACTADYGFLLTGQGRASLGELSINRYGASLLEGELDLLFSEGEVQARFAAPSCDMGLHGP